MEERHGRVLPFGTPVRYRQLGETRWRAGEAVEFERSELTFLCDTPLELHAAIEILLPASVQVMGGDAPLLLLCLGRVVRRLLANWPELRSTLVVGISTCQIASDPDTANAA